jgi:hypothetical protein
MGLSSVVTDLLRSGRTVTECLPGGLQSGGAPRRGLNPSDVLQAEAAFARAVSGLPGALRQAGMMLLARLVSPNWQMEWGLPRWLAESRGLPEPTCGSLVAANVLGLGYIRLTDDCIDGQAGALGPEATMRLASALYHEAIAIYETLIGPHAWFWAQLDRYLVEWRSAGTQILSVDVLHATHAEMQSLKLLGAPLQICIAAVCALASEENQLERLASPVGSCLVASVLLDHMSDWRDDLAGGRPNLFVRALLGEQPPRTEIDESLRRMAEAMLQTERVQTYLNLATGELQVAISASRRERLDDLTEYLCLLEEEVRQAADHLVGGIRSLLRQAAELIFSA